MTIPQQHRATIKALVKADPEVVQAVCDIPHLDPTIYIRKGEVADLLPYCGCFLGVYAWMQECKKGNEVPVNFRIPAIIAEHISYSDWELVDFATWCNTPAKDRLAVRYARSLLATANG